MAPGLSADPLPDVTSGVAAAASPADPLASAVSRAVQHNRRRTLALCGGPGLVVLVVATAVGLALGAPVVGLVAGAVLGVLCGVGLWRGSVKVVLRALGAEPVDEEDAPGPFTQAEWLCATMGLPLPAFYRVVDPSPNALAVGRGPGDAALVLTTGLIDVLDPVGVEGVLAHELAHLKRHDAAPATVAAALALVTGIGVGGGGALVHRLAGRGREFEADRMAVQATRYPPGLRQALATLAEGITPSTAEGGPPAPLAERRAGRAARWLFTVALSDRARRDPAEPDATGELDAASVRIAALDEW